MKKQKKINKVRQGLIAYENRKPDYEIGFESPDANSYAHVVNEKHKTVILSESQAESLRKYILLEDKRTKQAMNRARQVIREHFNNEPWLDTVFNHQDNPKGLTYLEYMLEQFIEQFYHNPQMRAGQTMRLMPLFCKLAFEFNFQNNNPDTQRLNRLMGILNHIHTLSQKGEDISKLSLDMSFDDLNKIYGSVIDAEAQAEEERMANTEYVKNEEYTVIGPVDFETAQKYGNESCPESKLCYTQAEQTWNNYTDRGDNSVYIILKDGWEGIPPQHDDLSRSAYDTYGLSMIFVFVTPFGELAYCNTRWNHRAEYRNGFSCDHAMSKEQISSLIGQPFKSVFKNKNGDLEQELIEALKREEDLNTIFDDTIPFGEFTIVRYKRKYNLLTPDKTFLFEDWFNNVTTTVGVDDYIIVEQGESYNIINLNGELVSQQWFRYIGAIKNNFTIIQYFDEYYNLLNLSTGNLIFSNPVEQISRLTPDIFRIRRENHNDYFNSVSFSYNCFNIKTMDFIGDVWYQFIGDIRNGFIMVYNEDEDGNVNVNFINTEGELISDQWFSESSYFDENGYAMVKNNEGKYNILKSNGKLISNQWFDYYSNFVSGFAKIGKRYYDEYGNPTTALVYNFINTDGKIISDQWFDDVEDFKIPTLAKVIKTNYETGKNYVNFINTDGDLIGDQWFDFCGGFVDGYTFVQLNGMYNIINVKGEILLDEWSDLKSVALTLGKLVYPTNENKKHKTLIITESQAKRLQKYLSEETNPEDVDLSSFKIQNKLNPKFWKNNKLDSRIRLKLLDIADDFVDSLEVDWVKPEDIIMTGSLANYTWNNEHSDIDLHILMDFKKVDDKVDFVRNYFKAKKDEWAEKHQELKIMGFPIEVYVQDKNENHAASGMYSLEKNEWIKKPDRKNFSDDDYEDDVVKETVSDYMNQIDDIIEKYEKTEDIHQIEDIYDEANEIFDNIKNERKDAFKKSTKELSTGNVIFKTLRRNGYIEKIIDLKNKSYDKLNSINESLERVPKLYHQTIDWDFDKIFDIIRYGLLPQQVDGEYNGIYFSKNHLFYGDQQCPTFSLPATDETFKKYNFTQYSQESALPVALDRIPFKDLTVELMPFGVDEYGKLLLSKTYLPDGYGYKSAKRKGISIAEQIAENKNLVNPVIYTDLFEMFVERGTSHIFDEYPHIKTKKLLS